MQRTAQTKSAPPRAVLPPREGPKAPKGRRRRFALDPGAPPAASAPPAAPLCPLLAPGPLRPEGAAPTPASGGPVATLQSQGVVGMQLCQRGDGAEVRLQWQLGDGVVEARLRETVRGVEILLSGSEHQPLLQRVAEILAGQRGTQAFELDGVEVDTQGDPNAQRQRPGPAPTDPESQGSRSRNGRRRATGPTAWRSPLPGVAGASYCR